jgi:hypothetical protein
LRSNAIPHFVQSPGLSVSTRGHIGQKYFAPDFGFTSVTEWQPQQDFISCDSDIGNPRKPTRTKPKSNLASFAVSVEDGHVKNSNPFLP